MPLYEYECKQCHRRTEKIQKFSDAELTVCPHCGGALERTLTAPAVQFKGAGWYKDLYSSPKPAATGGGGGEGASGSSGESATATTKSDSGAAAAPSAPAASAPASPSSGSTGS
jgi:putative FmdB family regulatory protein